MQQRSILGLPFWMKSLMLLSLGLMKASPLPCKEDIVATTTTTTTTTTTEATLSSITSNQPCGPHSQFYYGTVCPQSCDNLYYIFNTLCIEIAVQGCFCDQGYVLESDSSKNCVPEATCPISCADNMHYQTGVSPCLANCFQPSIPDNCDSSWRYDGCVCDDGYIISYRYPYNASNVCVRPSEC